MDEKLLNLHHWLLNNQKQISLTSDTGDIEEGWVVYTVSCRKKDLKRKIDNLMEEHKKGYPIK